jgi:hypothetical protein
MSDDEAIDDAEEHPAPQNNANDDDELTDTDDYYFLPPPRRRRGPLAILAVIVLIIVLVGGGLAIARAVGEGALGAAPTPTVTLLPGENLFYITTDPSWGTVSVDGHTLAHRPTLGGQPLTLAPGGHTIVWNAGPLPPQKCLIYVPPQQTSGGNCSTTDQAQVKSGKDSGLQATVIEFTLDTSMLSSAQFTSLSNAIQTYFNTFQATDTVQPGEQYVEANAPNNVATATQALKATFKLHLDTNSNSNLPCYPGNIGEQSCSSCYTFCSPSAGFDFNGPFGYAAIPSTWDIYVVANATWDYATLSGQSIAASQPDTIASSTLEYTFPLFISWTGSQWHVSDMPEKNGFSFFFDYTPICAVAQAILQNNTSLTSPFFSVTINGQSQTLSWQDDNSGKNLAQGCLSGAIIQPSNYNTPVAANAPEAYVLYRFGVLLAANSLAHQWWPNLPVASAYEQGIIQQLLPKHK